ncbi:MAG: 2-amino-4-hydroxy-6-hydroxymethyldihydropteridine diphosphokinase [Lachnospiraceae bacterium]|nr:2-amino-4-hydroxy-6-hydroxymethyldihydropteridine diphosphokinase [Lachnospiraceae bacterium]
MSKERYSDVITITDLEVYAYHGVFPEEKEKGQKFMVCSKLFLDTRPAGRSDDLTKSVHYGEVSHLITKIMQEKSYDLIETCAEKVAEGILKEYDLVKKLTIEIKKPEAPIGLPFGMVSVTITRGRHRAFVALGSNMGDTKGFLDMAVNELNNADGCKVVKVSDYIVTKPYGGVEQDDFLNGAMEIETLLTPDELLDLLHVIEQKAGRERKIHWGPRTLDLDILFYDDIIYSTDTLVIPHPEIQKRDFVLRPMAEIAGYFRHPILQETMTELLSMLQ